MSEKLDGLRAIWTGTQLLSRGGHAFHPPAWWTASLPAGVVLDGELYGGVGTLAKVSGMFRRIVPIDSDWQAVKFCVFDAPMAPGGILERARAAIEAIKGSRVAVVVEHVECKGYNHALEFLLSMHKSNGEGVMLRDSLAAYKSGRSSSLLRWGRRGAVYRRHDAFIKKIQRSRMPQDRS